MNRLLITLLAGIGLLAIAGAPTEAHAQGIGKKLAKKSQKAARDTSRAVDRDVVQAGKVIDPKVGSLPDICVTNPSLPPCQLDAKK